MKQQPRKGSAFLPCRRGRVPENNGGCQHTCLNVTGELRVPLQGGFFPATTSTRAFTAQKVSLLAGEAGRGAGSHLRVPLPPVTLEGKRAAV